MQFRNRSPSHGNVMRAPGKTFSQQRSYTSVPMQSISATCRYPQRAFKKLPKKIIRGSIDIESQTFIAAAPKLAWYEQLFEDFRAWMIESDRLARRQNFFERNQMWLFLGFFVFVWIIIFLTQYGMPFQSWTVDDLAMFIPKKHRGSVNPALAEIVETVTPVEPTPPAPKKPTPLEQRLMGNHTKSKRPSSPDRLKDRTRPTTKKEKGVLDAETQRVSALIRQMTARSRAVRERAASAERAKAADILKEASAPAQ